jgi:hypothetical protein
MMSITRIRSGENKIRENNEIMISNIRFKLVLESFPMHELKEKKT